MQYVYSQAISKYCGGELIGTAGTGKTEIIKVQHVLFFAHILMFLIRVLAFCAAEMC